MKEKVTMFFKEHGRKMIIGLLCVVLLSLLGVSLFFLSKDETIAEIFEPEIAVTEDGLAKAISEASGVIADVQDQYINKTEMDFSGIVSTLTKEKIDAALKDVEDGAKIDVDVNVVAEVIDKSDADKEVLSTISKAAPKATIGRIYDLSIQMTAVEKKFFGTEETILGELEESNKYISFTVRIPKELKNRGREFYILSCHNGEVTQLELFGNVDGSYGFYANKFSTFVLAYEDAVKVELPTVYYYDDYKDDEFPEEEEEEPQVINEDEEEEYVPPVIITTEYVAEGSNAITWTNKQIKMQMLSKEKYAYLNALLDATETVEPSQGMTAEVSLSWGSSQPPKSAVQYPYNQNGDVNQLITLDTDGTVRANGEKIDVLEKGTSVKYGIQMDLLNGSYTVWKYDVDNYVYNQLSDKTYAAKPLENGFVPTVLQISITGEKAGPILYVQDLAVYAGQKFANISGDDYIVITTTTDEEMDNPKLTDIGTNGVALLADSIAAYANGKDVALSSAPKLNKKGDDLLVSGDVLSTCLNIKGVKANKQYSLSKYVKKAGKKMVLDDNGLAVITDGVLNLSTTEDVKLMTLLRGYLETGEAVTNYAVSPKFTQEAIDEAIDRYMAAWQSNEGAKASAEGTTGALYYLSLVARMDPEAAHSKTGETAKEAALRILRFMIEGGHEPFACVGCYWGHAVVASSMVLIKNTPVLYDELTADEQERMDWLMKALAISGNWGYNDANNYDTGVDLRGNFNKSWNPNFRNTYLSIVLSASMYFGAEELDAIYTSFDYDTYIAKFNELGYTNILATWTEAGKELMENGGQAILVGGVNTPEGAGNLAGNGKGVKLPFAYTTTYENPFLEMGTTLYSDDIYEQFVNLVCYTYSWSVRSDYGNRKVGADDYSCIISGVASPYTGRMGMLREFAANDSGGIRSRVAYGFDSYEIINTVYTNMKLFGGWDSSTEEMRQIDNRIYVGNEDLLHKMQEGYYGYSIGNSKEEYESAYVARAAKQYKDMWRNFHSMQNEEIVVEDPVDTTSSFAEGVEPKDGITSAPEGAWTEVLRSASWTFPEEAFYSLGGRYSAGTVSFDVTVGEDMVDGAYASVIMLSQKNKEVGGSWEDANMLIQFQKGVIKVYDNESYRTTGLTFGPNYRYRISMDFDVDEETYAVKVQQTWPVDETKVYQTESYRFRKSGITTEYVDSLAIVTSDNQSKMWVENAKISGTKYVLRIPTVYYANDFNGEGKYDDYATFVTSKGNQIKSNSKFDKLYFHIGEEGIGKSCYMDANFMKKLDTSKPMFVQIDLQWGSKACPNATLQYQYNAAGKMNTLFNLDTEGNIYCGPENKKVTTISGVAMTKLAFKVDFKTNTYQVYQWNKIRGEYIAIEGAEFTLNKLSGGYLPTSMRLSVDSKIGSSRLYVDNFAIYGNKRFYADPFSLVSSQNASTGVEAPYTEPTQYLGKIRTLYANNYDDSARAVTEDASVVAVASQSAEIKKGTTGDNSYLKLTFGGGATSSYFDADITGAEITNTIVDLKLSTDNITSNKTSIRYNWGGGWNNLVSINENVITFGKTAIATITPGQWVHLQFKIDLAAGKVTAFVNGEKKGMISVTPSTAAPEVIRIFTNGGGKAGTLYVDDFAVYTGIDFKTNPFILDNSEKILSEDVYYSNNYNGEGAFEKSTQTFIKRGVSAYAGNGLGTAANTAVYLALLAPSSTVTTRYAGIQAQFMQPVDPSKGMVIETSLKVDGASAVKMPYGKIQIPYNASGDMNTLLEIEPLAGDTLKAIVKSGITTLNTSWAKNKVLKVAFKLNFVDSTYTVWVSGKQVGSTMSMTPFEAGFLPEYVQIRVDGSDQNQSRLFIDEMAVYKGDTLQDHPYDVLYPGDTKVILSVDDALPTMKFTQDDADVINALLNEDDKAIVKYGDDATITLKATVEEAAETKALVTAKGRTVMTAFKVLLTKAVGSKAQENIVTPFKLKISVPDELLSTSGRNFEIYEVVPNSTVDVKKVASIYDALSGTVTFDAEHGKTYVAGYFDASTYYAQQYNGNEWTTDGSTLIHKIANTKVEVNNATKPASVKFQYTSNTPTEPIWLDALVEDVVADKGMVIELKLQKNADGKEKHTLQYPYNDAGDMNSLFTVDKEGKVWVGTQEIGTVALGVWEGLAVKVNFEAGTYTVWKSVEDKYEQMGGNAYPLQALAEGYNPTHIRFLVERDNEASTKNSYLDDFVIYSGTEFDANPFHAAAGTVTVSDVTRGTGVPVIIYKDQNAKESLAAYVQDDIVGGNDVNIGLYVEQETVTSAMEGAVAFKTTLKKTVGSADPISLQAEKTVNITVTVPDSMKAAGKDRIFEVFEVNPEGNALTKITSNTYSAKNDKLTFTAKSSTTYVLGYVEVYYLNDYTSGLKANVDSVQKAGKNNVSVSGEKLLLDFQETGKNCNLKTTLALSGEFVMEFKLSAGDNGAARSNIRYRANDTNNNLLVITSNGQVKANNTLVATLSKDKETSFKIKINTTTGAYSVYVDGSDTAAASGTGTAGAMEYMQFYCQLTSGAAAGTKLYVDDFAIYSGNGLRTDLFVAE